MGQARLILIVINHAGSISECMQLSEGLIIDERLTKIIILISNRSYLLFNKHIHLRPFKHGKYISRSMAINHQQANFLQIITSTLNNLFIYYYLLV